MFDGVTFVPLYILECKFHHMDQGLNHMLIPTYVIIFKPMHLKYMCIPKLHMYNYLAILLQLCLISVTPCI